MRYVVLCCFILFCLIACESSDIYVVNNTDSGVDSKVMYENTPVDFIEADFNATYTILEDVDSNFDSSMFTVEDIERFAYHMAVAWHLSGYPNLNKVVDCLSNFEVKITNELPKTWYAGVYFYPERVDNSKPNFIIRIRPKVYESISLLTWATEFSHVAGACGLDDFDGNHSNEKLFLRHEYKNNLMALGIALQGLYLSSRNIDYSLSDKAKVQVEASLIY